MGSKTILNAQGHLLVGGRKRRVRHIHHHFIEKHRFAFRCFVPRGNHGIHLQTVFLADGNHVVAIAQEGKFAVSIGIEQFGAIGRLVVIDFLQIGGTNVEGFGFVYFAFKLSLAAIGVEVHILSSTRVLGKKIASSPKSAVGRGESEHQRIGAVEGLFAFAGVAIEWVLFEQQLGHIKRVLIILEI